MDRGTSSGGTTRSAVGSDEEREQGDEPDHETAGEKRQPNAAHDGPQPGASVGARVDGGLLASGGSAPPSSAEPTGCGRDVGSAVWNAATQVPAPGRWQHLLPDLVVVVAYLVAVALFAPFLVAGDGAFYYDLTRRFVGDGGVVYAYQWGTSLWNAPFYVVGHAIGLPYDVPLAHASGGDRFRDASITVAASIAAVGAVLVARRVVVRLGLPVQHAAAVGRALRHRALVLRHRRALVHPRRRRPRVQLCRLPRRSSVAGRAPSGLPPPSAPLSCGSSRSGTRTSRRCRDSSCRSLCGGRCVRCRASCSAGSPAPRSSWCSPLALGTGFGSTADLTPRGGPGGSTAARPHRPPDSAQDAGRAGPRAARVRTSLRRCARRLRARRFGARAGTASRLPRSALPVSASCWSTRPRARAGGAGRTRTASGS